MMMPQQEIYWSNRSLWLYLIIVIISFFLPNSFIQKIKFRNSEHLVPFGLILNTIFLILLKGCAGIGGDMLGVYQYAFFNSKSLSTFPDKTVEFGYKMLNVLVYDIFHNYNIFLFIVALITILPISYFVWKFHDMFDMGIVLGLYTCIWYFQSLSLIRIYLASSIALIAFFYEFKNKPLISLLWIIIATFFHNSAFILIISWMIRFNKIFSKKFYYLFFTLIFVCIFIFRNQIVGLFSGRYSIYGTASGRIGFEEILYYLPIFAIIYVGHHNLDLNKLPDKLHTLAVSYSFEGLGIGILKYAITIFGRMQALFLPLTFIISFYYKVMKKSTITAWVIKGIIIFYGIIRFLLYLKGYYDVDNIMPYHTFWGWSF